MEKINTCNHQQYSHLTNSDSISIKTVNTPNNKLSNENDLTPTENYDSDFSRYLNDDYSNLEPKPLPYENKGWGDSIEIPPESNHFRIYYQNINSISNRSMTKWQKNIDTITNYKCDIFGLSETCVDWDDKLTKSRYENKLRQSHNFSKIIGSTNRAKKLSSFIPGGTMTATVGNWTGRVTGYIQDPRRLNRWSGIKLRLKNQEELIVITAYRVCIQDMNKIGSTTSTSQQYIHLKEDGIQQPCPRKQFILDMIDQITELTSNQ